ncbi:hypothetical protein [Gordonia sp. MP11Mi]|uniref:Uncharacterized protein n=1 Tax=Gordonia sp. MP11Mi TaxID=3022769 RepID=A0AA97CUU5_9ACTN
MNRRVRTMIAGAGLFAGIAAAAAFGGVGEAAAAPNVVCAGSICHNHGDTVGIGYGNYTCPNGIVYPSIAVVMPHSTAAVFPANCSPAPSLY